MRRFIKNSRKGAAVELALLIIFVTVAMSSLIVTFSSMGSFKTKKALEDLSANVLLDSVADDYIGHLLSGNGQSFESVDGVEIVESNVEGDVVFFSLAVESGQTLSVRLIKNGTSYKILEWKY